MHQPATKKKRGPSLVNWLQLNVPTLQTRSQTRPEIQQDEGQNSGHITRWSFWGFWKGFPYLNHLLGWPPTLIPPTWWWKMMVYLCISKMNFVSLRITFPLRHADGRKGKTVTPWSEGSRTCLPQKISYLASNAPSRNWRTGITTRQPQSKHQSTQTKNAALKYSNYLPEV